MSDALVISGSITVGTPPEFSGWGPSPLHRPEVIKAARMYFFWKELMAKRVSLRDTMSALIEEAAAEDALRYSFIPVTPPPPKGPVSCQRSIDLP